MSHPEDNEIIEPYFARDEYEDSGRRVITRYIRDGGQASEYRVEEYDEYGNMTINRSI